MVVDNRCDEKADAPVSAALHCRDIAALGMVTDEKGEQTTRLTQRRLHRRDIPANAAKLLLDLVMLCLRSVCR